MEQKFCNSCDHYERYQVRGEDGRYEENVCKKTYKRDLVKGNIIAYSSCDTARKDTGICGTEGKLYESSGNANLFALFCIIAAILIGVSVFG